MRNHYNYVFDNITSTYNFTTQNNILYRVAFIVDETFSTISGENISNIFQLIVEKTTDEIEPYDARVAKTIEYIIESFFHNIENALIFICSNESEKAQQRHKIFDRWYKKSQLKNAVMKIDNIIHLRIDSLSIQSLYTSFMFHKKNKNYQKLIDIYNQIENILNEDKQ